MLGIFNFMGVDLMTMPLGVDLVFLVLMEVGLMLGRVVSVLS